MDEQYQVIWLPAAEQDLIAILEYIAADSTRAAKRIATDIQKKVEMLNIFPERGRIVPELKHIGIFGYRELIVNNWRVIYRIEQDHVYVFSVLDSRRDLESLLIERLIR